MEHKEIASRLVVAADYKPREHGGREGARRKVLELADQLSGLGVIIKVNSILRACGYDLINELHDRGLQVFADLKLIDIPETMSTDAELLSAYRPELVTVMCLAGVKGMSNFKLQIGTNTSVLGVTVLTSIDEEACQAIFTCSTKEAVLRLAKLAKESEIGGLVMSGKELEIVGQNVELALLSRNIPAIRPAWSIVNGEDQARIATPFDAITSGATRIIVGRPIVRANDPREAVIRTLEEIEQASS